MTPRGFGAYFGEPWSSGVCESGYRVDMPVGESCALCDTAIEDGDRGVFIGGLSGGLEPAHRECSLRSVLGGFGHLTDHGHWCREMGDPDGGVSYRQSALMVWAWVSVHGVDATSRVVP